MYTAAELRHRWRYLTALALLATAWAATVLGAAEGARRTDGAVDRFRRITSASDARFSIAEDRSGEALHAALRRRPEVEVSDALWFAGTGTAYDRGVFVNLVAPESGLWGTVIDRPIVLAGRVADPTRADEVTLTAKAADLLDVGPGDRLSIPTWDRDEWLAWLPTRGAFPAFNGPLVDVTVVGVVRVAFDLEATEDIGLMIIATPAFFATWGDQIGDNGRNIVVSLRDSGTDPDRIAEQLSTALDQPVAVSSAEDLYITHLRSAASVVSTGLWVLAIAVGISGGALLTIAFVRELRHSAERSTPLSALGATSGERIVIIASPLVLVMLVALVCSVMGAVLTSQFFPIGPGGLADPIRSIRVDSIVLLGGGLMLVVVLALSVAIAARTRDNHRLAPVRPRRLAASIDRLGPAAMVGRRNALGARRRLPLLAAALVVAGVIATTWFAMSLTELDNDATRWGYTWSSSPELGFSPDEYESAVSATAQNPAVTSVGEQHWADALINDRLVTISRFVTLGGSRVRPRLLSGRLPSTSDEIALGRETARRLAVEIGDTVLVRSSSRPYAPYTVVAIVVPPVTLATANAGDGAFMTEAGAGSVFPDPMPGARLMITYAPGADARALEDLLARSPGWVFDHRSHALRPGSLANLMEVSAIVKVLAGFFLVAGLTAALVAAARRGRQLTHEVGILRALGFTRRDVGVSALTEAVLVAVVGFVLGVPLGFVLGRISWRLATKHLGVFDVQSSLALSGMITLAMLAGAIAMACAVATRLATRASAAAVLREG